MIAAIRNSAKAIIMESSCLLVIANADAAGAYYILPGGGQRFGETLHEALLRECHEEMGVEVEVGALLFVREYIGNHHEFAAQDADAHQIEFMFACQIRNGRPALGSQPDTYQFGVQWLPIHELQRYRLYPLALRPLIQNVHRAVAATYLGDVN